MKRDLNPLYTLERLLRLETMAKYKPEFNRSDAMLKLLKSHILL